jgi:hypothetical protein
MLHMAAATPRPSPARRRTVRVFPGAANGQVEQRRSLSLLACGAACRDRAQRIVRLVRLFGHHLDKMRQDFPSFWTAPGILEALIPGRMQSYACTAEVPR